MIARVNFIVKTNQPLSVIQDPDAREFSKHGHLPLGVKTLRKVLLQMVELVEELFWKKHEKGWHGLFPTGWLD